MASKAMTTMATKSQHAAGKSCSLEHIVSSDSNFWVANRGNDLILQHSGGKKHQASGNLCFHQTTQHISYGEPSKQTLLLTKTHEKELVFKQSEVHQVKSAEAPCMLKVAESDCFLNHVTKLASYSCRYFLEIFPLSVWPSKPSYVVSDELSPCIFHQTAKNIKTCDARYPVIIHEAPTNGKTKQLDLITRYESNERTQVVSK